MNLLRVENEKGLCAYKIYMHIAPFHPQSSLCFRMHIHVFENPFFVFSS